MDYLVFKLLTPRVVTSLRDFLPGSFGCLPARLSLLAPKMLKTSGYSGKERCGLRKDGPMNGTTPGGERRRWPRLPLAIPLFVRCRADDADREFLEFATALNVSAGGMLIAVRHSIPYSAQVSLEIPSAPLAALATLPPTARNLRARVLRMQHGEGYNLAAVKFSRPLVESHKPRRRKLTSSV
jgi:hypothetical protein